MAVTAARDKAGKAAGLLQAAERQVREKKNEDGKE
jgi:hypothetical protein